MKNEKVNFETLLSNINNGKYYYVCYEHMVCYKHMGDDKNGWSIGFDTFVRGECLWDGDLVDCFYDDIFNNELKGKNGIVGNNFNEWQAYDRENNNGKNESLLYSKIVKIICECNLVYLKDKIDKLNDLMDLKYISMKNKKLIEHKYMIKSILYSKY
jgi:hypothetical protein